MSFFPALGAQTIKPRCQIQPPGSDNINPSEVEILAWLCFLLNLTIKDKVGLMQENVIALLHLFWIAPILLYLHASDHKYRSDGFGGR